jgi:Putative auto-transporter adhesin, head GIN domain
MKKLIFSLLAISILVTSCDDGWGLFDKTKRITGTGAVERTTRDVKDFKSIDLATSANVFVKQSAAFKVEVETQKNIAELFETVVENGVLKLKLKDGSWNLNFDKLNVYVEMPSVEGLDVGGSGDIAVETALSGDKLTLGISGSGNILAEKGLTVKTLKMVVTGSGDVKASGITVGEMSAEITGSGGLELAGTADKAHYSVTGSGDIVAKNVKSKSVEAQVTGSGNISCHADEALDAQSMGSGNISYSGNATVVKSKAMGSGSVSKE